MKTIKRYPNRKLYDTELSRYITLEEIANFLREGGEVRVVDSRTGEDLTAVTLAQVLVGEEKRSRPSVPIQRIIALLQSGSEFIQKKFGPPVSTLRGEAEKTVHRLIGEPAEELREFVMTTHKAYDEFQKRVDERLQVVLATVRNLNPILKDVDRLKAELKELKARVEALEARDGREG